MRSYGIPDKMVRLIEGIYAGFECVVVNGSVTSDWFMIKSGVKQGSVMSGFLFLLCLDWVSRKATADTRRGIRWNFTTMLEHLDFANDVALLSSKFNDLHEKTRRWAEEAARVGLELNTRNGKTSQSCLVLSVLVAGSRLWWMAKKWMTLRSIHTWELL